MLNIKPFILIATLFIFACNKNKPDCPSTDNKVLQKIVIAGSQDLTKSQIIDNLKILFPNEQIVDDGTLVTLADTHFIFKDNKLVSVRGK